MKRFLLRSLFAAFLCPVASLAQTASPATLSVPLTDAVERVLSEVPTRLVKLRGELLANNPEAVDYESILKLQGADNCFISVFNTPGDTTACWKADFPAVDDFTAAKRLYHDLYESLKNARISHLRPGTTYRLDAPYLAASEEKQSNSIEFVVTPANEKEFRKIRVQVMMLYTLPEWHLSVTIYEKPGELGMASVDEDAQ